MMARPLGYTPVMTDATKATTFDDIGRELNIFDTSTNSFVFRYVDKGRDFSQLVRPLEIVDLHDHTAAQRLIRGSGPEQMVIKNNMLFVTMLHSERIEAFRINQQPGDPSQILTPLGFEFTGGITPQGVEASPDGRDGLRRKHANRRRINPCPSTRTEISPATATSPSE